MTSLTRLEIEDYDPFGIQVDYSSRYDPAHASHIIKLDRNTFDHMPKSLEHLSMIRTPLEFIEPGVFKHLPNIKRLLLTENQLIESPFYLNEMPSLEHLSLSKNAIDSVDFSFSAPNDRLVTLDLSNNELKSFPNKITFSRLTVMDLSGNELKELSLNLMTNLPSLVNLNLQHNKIMKIETGVFDGLVNLRCLNLSHNEFKTFDFDVFNSNKMPVNLRFLNLESRALNKVKAKAESVFFLKNRNRVVVKVRYNDLSYSQPLSVLMEKNFVDLVNVVKR
jgi:Leucine-rich repeat (LRR) protein